jgi:hypothetical protein
MNHFSFNRLMGVDTREIFAIAILIYFIWGYDLAVILGEFFKYSEY